MSDNQISNTENSRMRKQAVYTRVVQCMEAKGWAYKTLALKLGVNRQSVNNYRTEGWPYSLYDKTAEVLDVSLEWLVRGSGAVSPWHEAVGKRIKHTLDAHNWEPSDLVDRLKNVETSHIPQDVDFAKKKAEYGLGYFTAISIHMLIHGANPHLAFFIIDIANALDVNKAWLEGNEEWAEEELFDLPAWNKLVVVPKMAAIPSMGGGGAMDIRHSEEIGAISVTKEWLHKNLQAFGGVNHLSLVTGRGDSMADTFYDGDVLFVDQSVTSVKYDGIYVYSFEDRLYLKRLSLNFDGSIEVISDNSRYSTEIILPDQREGMFVHGRIVGVWQSKKL